MIMRQVFKTTIIKPLLNHTVWHRVRKNKTFARYNISHKPLNIVPLSLIAIKKITSPALREKKLDLNKSKIIIKKDDS